MFVLDVVSAGLADDIPQRIPRCHLSWDRSGAFHKMVDDLKKDRQAAYEVSDREWRPISTSVKSSLV